VQAAGGLAKVLQRCQHLFGLRQQRSAVAREGQALGGAGEQLQLAALLQGFDLQTDRRLRKMQTLGSAGHIAFACHGAKGLEADNVVVVNRRRSGSGDHG
jgi:hypothetical protein